MQSPVLKIGTRGSPLALYQANLVQRLICETSGRSRDEVEIKILKTSGDTIKGELKDFGGLKKLEDGVCDATMLACAGLRRLEQDDRITQAIETDVMLPAPAQGAIGIEIRRENSALADILAPLNDRSSELEITAERAFLRALDGNCRTPIAALARLEGERLTLKGEILAKDGSLRVGHAVTDNVTTAFDAYDLGFKMGEAVRDEVAGRITFDDEDA